MTDFTIENHGSIYLFQPHTTAARAHLKTHTGDEVQWFGTALAVEPRYVEDLAGHLVADGFTVSGRQWIGREQ